MVEAEVCAEEFNWPDCSLFSCKTECIKRHGKSATAMCDDIFLCICNFPCN